ncbi:DUF1223 domain-containing protein [Aestuariirhabdus sp. LZHN29]|uniref:DUF1223 domain-containing protein n=1 Tax=Aestuariirhabdus sp. LZHN29 TaxID=3417462 RepID=UPI003CF54687
MIRLLTLWLLALSPLSWGWQVSSGPTQTPLLELYTSEGCSSCPTADLWFHRLTRHPDLWQGFVPVAFHVDYWDWMGWKDRFASPSHSNRQRTYQQQGGLKAVYTPGFVVNGDEWRNWFRHSSNTEPPQPGGAAGLLNLTQQGNELIALFQPATTPSASQHYTLDLVITGFGLSNRIDAGENQGKVLQHDFVVLHHIRQMSYPQAQHPGEIRWRIELPAPATIATTTAAAPQTAISAWVSAGERLQPLQAAGGWWSPQR